MMFRPALLSLTLLATTAAAQLDHRPDHPGTWTWRAVSELGEPRLTAVERTTVLSQLRAIGEVVRGMPLLQPPRGVTIRADERLDLGCGHNERLCGSRSVPAWMDVAVMGFVREADGRIVARGVEPPGFMIGVNDPTLALHGHEYDYERLVDADGREIFAGLRELERVGGTVVWDNNVVILTRDNRPLTVPVSREAFLRALIRRHAAVPQVAGPLRAELAALSPLARREPAWVGEAESISKLVPASAEGATPLVMVNPGLFDPALPRTAVQLIAIRFTYGARYMDEHPTPPNYAPDAIRTWEIRQALDYERLRSLMR